MTTDTGKKTKILIIRLSSLGDIILTTPVLRAIKRKYPDSFITYITKTQYADVLRYNPKIDELITLRRDYQFLAGNQPDLKKYDIVLDLQNNLRSRKLLKGFTGKVFRFRKHSIAKLLAVYFKKKDKLPALSIPERYIAAFTGLTTDSEGCEFYFPEREKPGVQLNRKVIGICPGSRHFTKQWGLEYYAELARLLCDEGFEVRIVGGADDKEAGEYIKQLVPETQNYCGRDDLYMIAGALEQCRGVVCNDSGLMHLSSALKVPVVAIFGSTIRQFGFTPYNAKHIILENNSLSCRPCSHIGRDKCPKIHFRCMKEITPALVKQKLLELIK